MIKLLALCAVLLLCAPARAEPPPGVDPNSDTALWYRSLKQPGTGKGCCSISDCAPAAYRIKDGHYEVLVPAAKFYRGDDQWHVVPSELVLHGVTNPTGFAVLCWVAGSVYCFTPPSLT